MFKIKMLTLVATLVAIVVAGPILSIGQSVHGQGGGHTTTPINCDKVTGHNAEWGIGCNFGVHDCTNKHTYDDKAKKPDKDYTAGYKYGWSHSGCLLPK